MAWWFLLGELYGLAGLLCVWIISGGRDTQRRRTWIAEMRAGGAVMIGAKAH